VAFSSDLLIWNQPESRAGSFTIDLAGDGESGEETAKIGLYDAIILDLLLPGQADRTSRRSFRHDKIESSIPAPTHAFVRSAVRIRVLIPTGISKL